MDLYQKYKGRIDEQFGFKAFDSAPLVAASTMDAKITNSAMASRMMVWAEFGRPNETVAAARDASNHGLYPGGYYLFSAQPTDGLMASIAANEKARLAPEKRTSRAKPAAVSWKRRSGETLEGMDSAGFGRRYMVCRGSGGLSSRAAFGGRGQGDRSRAHPVSRAEAFARCARREVSGLRRRRARCSSTVCAARWATTSS